jgi:NET1-associated nuclear protein 1 (U3 small nucleolar RNA-associated protein 17)
MWQLDTGKKDYLPHLSATIENIVVSARGSAYVLHLDDNSVMVLSTAEMKPTAYVSGVQSLLAPQPFSKDDLVRRVGFNYSNRIFKTPVAVNPCDPSKIILSVGNGQQVSHTASGPATPLMQTVDLSTIQGVSKQALTRVVSTDVNTTASGQNLTEPRVTHMTFSQDGRWLTTIDEWQPPARDASSLEVNTSSKREVYLKFWSVSAEDQSLDLVSRINAPHQAGQSESVMDLAADPTASRFATVGMDGMVRVWQPAVRQRDGIPIKSRKGRQLQAWSCSQAIGIQQRGSTSAADVSVHANSKATGAVAFSEDGSILVCAYEDAQESAVHIIDVESGKIRTSLDGLTRGSIQGVRLLSTKLIILSDDVVVYDVVQDQLCYGLRTRGDEQSLGSPLLAHLAVNHQTSCFAVAISRKNLEMTSIRSELAIFSPDRSEPELVREFPCPLVAVVAVPGSGGFLSLDTGAHLWSVNQGRESTSAFAQPLADLNLDHVDSTTPAAETETVQLIEDDGEEPASGDEMEVDAPEDAAVEDHVYPAVVQPQKLAEVFDAAPAFAMPPIEDMFYQVTKMFSPNTSPATAA